MSVVIHLVSILSRLTLCAFFIF